MTLSLDSNVLIDIINGHELVRRRYRDARLAGEPLAVSSIAAHEVLFGAAISTRPIVQTKSALELLTSIPVGDFSWEDAVRAAELRGQLRRGGEPIGGFDMLIAGQCLQRGWAVVTANTREFRRVEGLPVHDWSQP